jgi:hypothetical protein
VRKWVFVVAWDVAYTMLRYFSVYITDNMKFIFLSLYSDKDKISRGIIRGTAKRTSNRTKK